MSVSNRTAASTFERVAIDLTHKPFPQLAAAIHARSDRIIKHWRLQSLKAMPHLDVLTLEEFEDTIAETLCAAGEALKSADPQQLRGVMESGPQHGIDRFLQKQSLLDLFEEVRILRSVVVVAIGAEMQRPLAIDEAASFHAIFDVIAQQAAMALVQKQDEQLQATQATTREMNEKLLISSVHQHALAEQARAAEAALSDSEERFRMLADNMSQFAWVCDVLGDATWYNRRWYDYTGTTFEEMQRTGWRQVLHPEHVERVEQGIERSRRSGVPWEDTFPLRRHDGQYRWFLSRAQPIYNGDGQVVRWFGTNTDVTQQRELEKQLHDQADTLADLHRRKDEFLAMLGHELRNPLAPIANAVQLLRLQKDETPLQHKARDVIERQVAQMTRLIDDLLEVSRITTGRIHLHKERVDINGIVQNAVETVRSQISQRRHSLELSLSPQPTFVDADAARLEQVVVNLLTNAAKYTDEGGTIWLLVSQEADEAIVRVRDTGVGIAPELLPRIFDLFTQADRSLDRSQGGLGIGLCLVERLVKMHEGTVTVHSTLGQGSEFVVRLPLLQTAAPRALPSQAGDEPVGRALRVLVVDDRRDTGEMTAMLLDAIGHEVRTAVDGPTALETALEFLPHVVLLDIGLPGMNGYEVARRIRQQPTLAGVRLIAITGYGQESDRQQTREAGFDHHLVKPADFRLVEELLENVARQIGEARPPQ